MGVCLSENCRVCAAPAAHVFTQPLLDHPVAYFECPRCGYLQTQMPHWLDQAYSSAINDVDVGIMWRNRRNADFVVMSLLALGVLRGRVIDHAGGYGILVRLLRDAGVDAYWRDKYCENVLARGFEATEADCDLLTAFEVFEHLVDPVAELEAMLGKAPTVLLSTELVPTLATPPASWWYLGPEHGQHIGFFRTSTLQWMARKLGCHHASDGSSLHIFSRQPVPWSWRHLLTLRQFAPLVARCALKSRMMNDFERLRASR